MGHGDGLRRCCRAALGAHNGDTPRRREADITIPRVYGDGASFFIHGVVAQRAARPLGMANASLSSPRL